MVKLKAIESREDVFCCLSFYLHRSFLGLSPHCNIRPLHHQVLEPMRRPLVVGYRVDCLQAIESSCRCKNPCSYRCAIGSASHGIIESFESLREPTRFVAPSDRLQPLSHRGLELSRGIEVSSRCAIRSSSSGRATLVIELSSKCNGLS